MIKISINPARERSLFKTWFDSDYYHKLYRDRDDKEARAFIDALLSAIQPDAGSSILDLGCGTGRHSKYLAKQGFNVTGLDLSQSSIRQARKSTTDFLQFHQHDMRMPFGKKRYDLVFNFFTSFGYFDDAKQNEQVVENISASLKDDGLVLFDYINVFYAEEHLVAVEEKEIDGVLYHINRWADTQFIYKRIAIQGRNMRPLVFVEKVARFDLDAFNGFFRLHGLKTVNVYGDYCLNDFSESESKRLIILAKKCS
jgi:SAM-dependent methyltransferase